MADFEESNEEAGEHVQTSQPGNRPGREKPTPHSMHIQF